MGRPAEVKGKRLDATPYYRNYGKYLPNEWVVRWLMVGPDGQGTETVRYKITSDKNGEYMAMTHNGVAHIESGREAIDQTKEEHKHSIEENYNK